MKPHSDKLRKWVVRILAALMALLLFASMFSMLIFR